MISSLRNIFELEDENIRFRGRPIVSFITTVVQRTIRAINVSVSTEMKHTSPVTDEGNNFIMSTFIIQYLSVLDQAVTSSAKTITLNIPRVTILSAANGTEEHIWRFQCRIT